MANLAIQGHATRGKEVIKILEMLGGKNERCLNGTDNNLIYGTSADDYIVTFYSVSSKYKVFSLEEFLEKYPYKIGDKVVVSESGKVVTIISMSWRNGREIIYETVHKGDCCECFSVDELQPNKKQETDNLILNQLIGYFNNTPRDILEKEWHKYDKNNEVGPAVDKYLNYINTIRQPQYPKTYAECCEILNICPNGNIVYAGNWVYGGDYLDKHLESIRNFQKLLICRNAYWKIAGEQMGLDKPWEPNFKDNQDKYFICYLKDEIWRSNIRDCNRLLVFPTEKIRDEFYENFKELIKDCKNLI